MPVVGIIAEYNPFHLGHAYQIDRVRRLLGADSPVVAVMSGNFVQRGDFAALDALVPPATLDYFRSPEAQPVLERIRSAGDVVHY